MREILFRGKRVDNSEWVYGAFCPDLLEIEDGREVDWGFIRTYNKITDKMEMIEVDRKTVGQSTGLCDKNGIKIFEGDIMKQTFNIPENIEKIVFDIVEFCEYTQDGDGGHDSYTPSKCLGFNSGRNSILEEIGVSFVVGNKFDNSELLKKVEE